MSEKIKQELNDYISQYTKIVQDSLGNDDARSLAKNKIIFQNYYDDFSHFVKTNLEVNDAKRYLRYLDALNRMVSFYFLYLNGIPGSILMLIDQNEDRKKPEFKKLFRTIEEISNFFAIESDRISESKIKFIELPVNENTGVVKLMRKAFIVHGHDETTQLKTARFLEKLGFEAIILHEQANSGKTIIEKLEHFTDVGFGIVLYSPDDVGESIAKKDQLRSRARQNVVFEHGLLIGKLGRKKVFPLVKDKNVELPGDISGMVYLSDASWELQLAKEIRELGYEIDMNKVV
mgnify:FL=1